jgi:pimeloyl-ACP methyl ester carboxylesterase/tetratricopeptide (TPR) repeat protein
MKPLALILALLLSISAHGQHGHGSHGSAAKKPVWLDDGLGAVDHPVSTKNPEAQKFFNQGLAYLYAFNHAEGINSFRHAAELDPEMAMAFWGVSLGLGSNYNVSADEAQLVEAYENLQKAISLASKATQADRDYIAALSKRYAKDPKTDRAKLANEYKIAMGELVKKYPDDLDAATLYAESMMNLRPWQLWTLDGKPAEGTLEIVAVLEGVLKRNPRHTGANHYYIHAIEASPNPERGLAAADRLLGLAPNAGHLVHMPSHIYLRTGDHDVAVKSNDLAIVADKRYLDKSGATGVYPLMYYNHNIHMLAASHAGAGNFAGAVKAAKELESNVRPNLKAMPMLEMFMPYHLVTLMRFGKWNDVLAYPQPDAESKITTAFWRLARGLASSEHGKTKEAESELATLQNVIKTIPADAGIGNSSAHGVMRVAVELLTGEIALSKGDAANGLAALRRAVAAEDLVNYNEPPDWHLPTREWLGRALMRAGEYVEAEAVFRKEIEKNPKNGRALFGLAESLAKQGKTTSAELVRKEFAAAWKNSDTTLSPRIFDGKTAAVNVITDKIKLKTGVTITYKEMGDPKGPALILLHGYGDSSFSFSRTAPMLDQRYRIIAPDQRGHGDSDKPASGYEMKNFAADVAALMDALGIRSATVVGHSMGSFVSMQLALDHPAKVERLVLIGTAATPNNKVVKELRAVVNELNDPVPQEFIREFQSGASSPSLPKEFFDGVIDASSKLPANVWKKVAAGLTTADYTAELGKIKVPVTIFWGEKETIFSREEQEPLLKGLSKVKFIVYPNSGHSPNWEEPERFAGDLNAILHKVTN